VIRNKIVRRKAVDGIVDSNTSVYGLVEMKVALRYS